MYLEITRCELMKANCISHEYERLKKQTKKWVDLSPVTIASKSCTKNCDYNILP